MKGAAHGQRRNKTEKIVIKLPAGSSKEQKIGEQLVGIRREKKGSTNKQTGRERERGREKAGEIKPPKQS